MEASDVDGTSAVRLPVEGQPGGRPEDPPEDRPGVRPVDQQTESPAADPPLPPVMADLSHIVHNASNLVLGHLAAIQRAPGRDARLDERARVIETALGRITDVVNALRAALDADYWGPAEPKLLDQVVADSWHAVDKEATRRRIQLHAAPDDPDATSPTSPAPTRTSTTWLPDGNRASSLLSALLASEVERLGSGGSLTLTCTDVDGARTGAPAIPPGSPVGAVRIDVEARRDDQLALYRDGDASVWYWIAERFAAELGATLEQDVAAHTTSVVLPVSGGPRPR